MDNVPDLPSIGRGFYCYLVSADFFDDDVAFYRITSIQPGPFAKLLWHLVILSLYHFGSFSAE